MKVEKSITFKEAIDITITKARLLTKKEEKTLPKKLRLYDNWWWTSTARAVSPSDAWDVPGSRGSLYLDYVDFEGAVRPALVFESKDLEVGDKFFFANKEFEVIKEGLAFCTTDIGKSAFRTDWKAEDANDYKKSDIKKFIDKWFEENIK